MRTFIMLYENFLCSAYWMFSITVSVIRIADHILVYGPRSGRILRLENIIKCKKNYQQCIFSLTDGRTDGHQNFY